MADGKGTSPRGATVGAGQSLSRRDLLRYGVIGAGVVGVSPILGACASSASPEATTSTRSTPRRGGTLSFGRQTGPTQLDPANSIVEGDVYTLDKIFEPLYITSPQGKLVPWLAEGHTVSSDGKTWTFSLRPGVKFSDGKPVTRRRRGVLDPPRRHRTGRAAQLLGLRHQVAQGDRHPHGHLSALPALGAFPFRHLRVPNAILPDNFRGASEAAFFANPVGTGPFTLKSFVKGGNAVLVRNKDYWQSGKPYLDEVNFVYIPDDDRRVEQLKGGEVDVISAVPPAQVTSLKSNHGPRAQGFRLVGRRPVVLQREGAAVQRPPCAPSDQLRHQHPLLAKATTFGTAQPGNSFFPPSLQYYAKVPTLGFSVKAAKAELASSAYPHGFSTSILVPSGNTQYVEAATVIQQYLKPLNIDVSIRELDDAAYTAAFEAFNYEAMINGATNDISDPDEMASFQVDVEDGGSHSFWTYYDDPSAIALVREAEVTFNNAKRAELYEKIQAIVAQDAPYIALDYPPNIYAWLPSLNNFAVNPGGAYRLEDVWLT